MTKDEALTLALATLEGVLDDSPKVLDASISGGLYEVVQCRDAIAALKKALAQPAQPAQEPVAWVVEFENGEQELHFEEPSVGETITPLYTTPPQRPWVELTDEDIDNFFKAVWGPKVTPTDFIRSIEQALKEKNT